MAVSLASIACGEWQSSWILDGHMEWKGNRTEKGYMNMIRRHFVNGQ
jgi:hypothetical protein